jgi:hypothetical protein
VGVAGCGVDGGVEGVELGTLDAVASAEGPSAVPQVEQKRAPGELADPQLGQPMLSDWPHWLQKRASAAFSDEQFGQITAAKPLSA